MTGPSVDRDKLGRYLAGEASADDAAEMRRWLEEHPSDARVIAALDAATKGMASEPPVDVEGALRKVKTRMRAPAPQPSRWRFNVGATEAIAAAAAIILVAGVAIWRSNTRPVRGAPEVTAAVHATGVGERKTVRLADGTTVILGPASRIDARGRDVVLTGEAFFRVVHDSRQPFTVHAGNASIRDVGTEFSVHDDGGERVRVVVSEGSVQLADARDTVTLARGDVGLVQAGRIQADRGAATPDDLAWTTGTLVFRDAAFSEVAADLKRWYGVEVRVSDSALLHRHFTGSFTTEPAGRVLDVLALALGARVDRRGDTAYIRATSNIK